MMAVHAHTPWGRVHYFIIEHAPMAELVAIDELLEKAGWSSDGCRELNER
ncbi:hypothetical protein ACLB1Q_34950 [Escherichia coli]